VVVAKACEKLVAQLRVFGKCAMDEFTQIVG
jgi:hypothetical protein